MNDILRINGIVMGSMWNLIKNVFRSLKRNKASVIGLTFLVFLSIGIFTVLNSVSSNISNEYARITTSGNIHDFTVSENYEIGNPKYDFTNNPSFDDPVSPNQYMGKSSDNKDVPWPLQPETPNGRRTYMVSLNANDQANSLIKAFYDLHNNPSDSYYSALLHPIITINNEKTDFQTLSYLNASTDHISDKSYDQIMEELSDDKSGDLALLGAEENAIVAELVNTVTQTDTPMEKYLDNDMKDKVAWRNFKSLDIDNSPDGKLYKIVQSNPEDKIDKIVLFNENQHENFSTSLFDPMYGSGVDLKELFKDDAITDPIEACLSYNDKLPSAFSDFQKDPKAKAFFKLLARGDDVSQIKSVDENLYNYIKGLAENPTETEYENYLSAYKEHALIQNKGYRYSVNWTIETPQSWTLSDWTARYVVISPEYLSRNGLSAYAIKDTNTFVQDLNSGYSNNIDGEYTNNKWNDFLNDNPKNVILNSNDSTKLPFVVIGSGATADFTYPIINLQHIIPNPNKECVIFANTNAYKRVFDSYRGNPTENYLVGTFNKGVNATQTLNQMNQIAEQKMSWPKGIKACYMANDTNNVLNASAFRVAFIPGLVSKIQLVDIVLTFFIIFLSLFICIIVIHRYIKNSRMQIGIIQANGISKRKIAFSLVPFALLPAVVGGIGGYLIGFFIQRPAISLFGNYWMLPTPIASFNIWIMIISILLPFLIFLIVSIIATFVLLREKTVDLMKNGGEFKGNFIARHIKEPFRSFSIMTKFRLSAAFSSIWKLFILAVMVAMSMSTLIFSINMIGKFEYAESKTFASRNYSYAIDLYSPTSQGGQYVPVDADVLGQSGFIESPEGKNWLPNLYFDKDSVVDPGSHDLVPDKTYETIFCSAKADEDYKYYGIPKIYYYETYAAYDIGIHGVTTSNYGDIERSFIETTGDNSNVVHGTTFYPMMGDAVGENNDIMFLKNRTMFKSGIDFTVGALGMTSNPWSIAVSLMPENNKNLADGRTTNIIQALGEATMWGDGTTPDKDNPYGMYYNNDNFTSARDKKFFQEDKAPITRNDPNCPINYSFDEKTCIPKIPYIGISLGNLDPTFMSFLNYVYDNTNFLTTSQNTLMDSDYQISYNKIPLKSDDETYTYLDATKIGENSSTRILGLKNNSQYVNLIDAGGINLNNLIDDLHTTKAIKDGYNPIIINAYAQHKYKLKVGDIIKFNINNKTDRIEQQITSSSIDSSIPFKVVGINTTYQGEEYFTNQQLANQILGLRNNFSDSYNLHNYYFNSEKQDSVTKTWYSETINTEKNPASVVYDLMDLSDINSNNEYLNPALNYINDGESLGKITPLGFNGVFTKKTNGSSVLNCGQYLYAPSGIYPGNDALDSDVVKNVLRQSANLEIANIVSGLIKTDIGKKINNDFLTWQANPHTEANFKNMISDDNINAFINKLKEIYGTTSVVSLVSGATDRNSTHLIFTNFSNTITEVESTVLAIIGLMVVIIVMLITVMLINDSKKLTAILKALGYSDNENAQSFLAIYVPVILIGLLLAIPLSFAIIYVFQGIIFAGVGILLPASIKWWSFVVGVLAILAIFTVSGFWGYYSLRKDRLIDMMKE